MARIKRIPTDEEILSEIQKLTSYVKWLEGLLKLNEKGKELAIIHLLGISQLEKYTKKEGGRHENSNPAAGNRSDSCADCSGRGTCPHPGFAVPDAPAAETDRKIKARSKGKGARKLRQK